jgi:hypothetical protein
LFRSLSEDGCDYAVSAGILGEELGHGHRQVRHVMEHQRRGNDLSGASAFARTQNKRWHS